MAGAIAQIYGHDLSSDRIRTFVLIAIVGDSAKELVKTVGIDIGKRLTANLISSISGSSLSQINRLVGMPFLTKAGETGVVNLSKAIPLAGGVVGGVFDAASCRFVGRTAKGLFRREPRKKRASHNLAFEQR